MAGRAPVINLGRGARRGQARRDRYGEAARGDDKKSADPANAWFIESVWIAPSMRRNGVGKRLVSFIIEGGRKVGIKDFYLWVFDHNAPAIGLYQDMEFGPTGRSAELPVSQAREVQYVLKFDGDGTNDDALRQNAAERGLDHEKFGITYRLLGHRPGLIGGVPTGRPNGTRQALRRDTGRVPG